MSDSRIKVLQIVGNTQLGGVASCLLNYMKFSDKSRYRYDFVTYGKSSFDEKVAEIDPQSRIYYIPPLGRDPFDARQCIMEICAEGKYKIVHSHLSILSCMVLPRAAAVGVPVRICHAHSTFNRHSDKYIIKKFMRPFACRGATHLMACGKAAAENTFGKRAKETHILPNAVEVSRFACTKEEHERARETCGLTKTTALFTGRFVYQKNLEFLLNAFARADADMELVLLGDGALKKDLMAQCGKLNITDKVRFVSPCEPDIWYKAADVFCLPSRYEGFSISALEAQSAGLPCLFSENVSKETDVTGNCTILKDDINVWAQALNGQFVRDYGANNAVTAAGFDIKKEAHRLNDYYDSLLQGTEN